MSVIKEVIDLDSNDKLEEISKDAKESNDLSNYNLEGALQCILSELQEITKQLKKINS